MGSRTAQWPKGGSHRLSGSELIGVRSNRRSAGGCAWARILQVWKAIIGP